MNVFEKIEQEEKEAEELLFGKENPGESALSEEEGEEVVEVIQPIVEIESEEEKSSWKKRFTNFKATTDNTIFQLRKENASLKSDIAILTERSEKTLSELVDLKRQISTRQKEESFNDLFTQEDEELLGSEAINIFKKAVKKVAPQEDSEELKILKEEINQLKKDKIKKLKEEEENLNEESFGSLKSRLSKLVEDWEDIDLDPNFATYLEELDEIDLVPRKQLFSSAVQSRSAKSVARFYEDYKKQRPSSKEDILSKKVTPVGDGGGSVNMDKENKKTYTIQEYNKFMDDLTKGKYRGREKEARILEAKFDKAFIEGRIVD